MWNSFKYFGLLLISVTIDAANRCGKATVDENRIVFGQPADRGANPWIVSLEMYDANYNSWDHQCAGTLVNRQWIITAAHCFKLSNEPTRWRVVAGQYDRKVTECSEQVLNVTTILSHPRYRPIDHRHDIAMVMLDGKFRTGGTHVRTVCLPDKDLVFADNTHCTIAGWGQNMFTVSREDSHKLLYYNSTILPRDECRIEADKIAEEDGTPMGSVSEEMICIKSEFDRSLPVRERGTGGVCGGDSGGPLICTHDGLQYMAGVVSWSLRRPCGYTHDVFTRLQVYLDWVNDMKHAIISTNARPSMPPNC